jgi:multidrug efflux pump subunit AcrB
LGKSGRCCKIKDSFAEETIINKTLGEKSITLTVVKKESADIIKTVDQVNGEIENFKKILPPTTLSQNLTTSLIM